MFKKPDKVTLIILIFSTIYYEIANVIAQALINNGILKGEYFFTWPFFLASCLYFMLPGTDGPKKCALKAFFGSLTGIIGAVVMILIYLVLMGKGAGPTLAIAIGILIPMAIIIIGGGFFDICFNSVAFCYWIVASIDAEMLMTHWVGYMISSSLGVLLLCIPSGTIMILIGKHYMEKAALDGNKTE